MSDGAERITNMQWRYLEIVGVLVAAAAFVALAAWAFVVAVRELGRGYRDALRRPRFDLLDLLILVTVLAASLSAVRWFWDSIYLGIVLLVVPMLAPLPWIAKFLYEDARLSREKRRQQRATVVSSFEVPSADAAAPRSKRRRVLPPPQSPRTWMPPLTPLSLTARPLQDDD
jgi:hypothetical protein